MSSCFLFLLSLQIIQVLSYSFSLSGGGNETDRDSLLAFKDQITNDPFGTLSSWNESMHFCQWSGVACGHRHHHRVIVIDLRSRQLEGSLSPHIGNLSFLRILNLANNSLANDVPHEIGRLFRLRMLALNNNAFGGEIPDNISRCSNLLELRLHQNNLTGELPKELGSLPKLQVFAFSHNNLVGEIPSSFGNLSFILTISGSDNHLQGGIPNSIGQLSKLKELLFTINNLSGTIPPSIYNLSSLATFSVALNQFHGSLPANLGNTLPKLEILSMHSNQFTGQIPVTLSNASNLWQIELLDNFFIGKVPNLASLHNLRYLLISNNSLGNSEDDDMGFLYHLANNTNLEKLGINDNNLGGVLPEIVSNFSTRLTILAVARNRIRGNIPKEIGNLISLNVLSLEENRFTGTIPRSISKLQNLALLYVGVNKIMGNIPSSLGNITSLLQVDLGHNNLQGRIPASLGNCRNLLVLVLAGNSLSGPIPKEVVGVSSLSLLLDLSENKLTTLPSEVGKLVNLGDLDVSRNKLSGEIPISLGSCLSLVNLFLDDNFFQGHIPQSLSSLRAIEELSLSHNNLTGQIPMFLAKFKFLTDLGLSFNDLEGEVPLFGVFNNPRAISILGNKRLCGGISQLNLPKCTSHVSTKPKSPSKLILLIAIPCGIFALISIVSFMLLYCYGKTKIKLASRASWEVSFWRVTYEELFRATGGFSSSNLIGTGSFGSVYEGILASDGRFIAVKVFNLLRKGASRSFMAECETLINIRHRNLVKVLTACSSIDFQGNDFKALVYEFMVNGSLERWLHPIRMPHEAQESRNLNLVQRLNIAIDVANALDYLHHHCQTHIVHCDLKPSNILLDGDMTAHVGDFGLARFRPEDSNQSSINQSSSIGVKGTIGYIAPEYGIESEVSTYGDVYSYGILLLELFTGKRPTDDMFKEERSLHNYVKMALPDHVAEIVDPTILREVKEETSGGTSRKMNKFLGCLTSIMNIGIACSVELPSERIDISNVVVELHRISGILQGIRSLR